MRPGAGLVLLALAAAASLGGCVPPPEASSGADAARAVPPPVPGRSEALIYAGDSAWRPEVDSLQQVIEARGSSAQLVTSSQLDALSLDDLASFGALVFPGGDSIAMSASLSRAAKERLREAVQERGVGYLGFCAGAWAAIAPRPEPGRDASFGFGVVDGPVQEMTSMARAGQHYAMLEAALAGGGRRHLLWYGGPITPEEPGGVLARYPDGTPAITRIRSGRGVVIVSGLHPAAPPAVIASLGLRDEDGTDYDLAWQLYEQVAGRGQPR